MGRKIRYISVTDKIMVEDEIAKETDPDIHPLHSQLQTSEVYLVSDETTKRKMIVAEAPAGYDLIDNEILAGLLLYRQAGDAQYPAEVSRLVGYSPDGTEPFVLLEPYRGIPIGQFAGKLLTADRMRFQISMLTALRWLNVAGLAHRGINPHTVRWDEDTRTVQITGFQDATIFGAPRQVTGIPPWSAPEQRPNRITGEVGDRDDIWAAGRLIFYVITGEEPSDRDSITAEPELGQLLEGVFQPPEERPSCRELLISRLGGTDPVPAARQDNSALEQGRNDFWSYYSGKKAHGAFSNKPVSSPIADRPPGNNYGPWVRPLIFGAVIAAALIVIIVALQISR